MWAGDMRKIHNRPRNEQDCEALCLKLLRAHWKCPELQLYATRRRLSTEWTSLT